MNPVQGFQGAVVLFFMVYCQGLGFRVELVRDMITGRCKEYMGVHAGRAGHEDHVYVWASGY